MLRSAICLFVLALTCGQSTSIHSTSKPCDIESYALYRWDLGLTQWIRIPMDMGEFHISVTFEQCERTAQDTFLLSGAAHYPYPKGRSLAPATGIRIWQANPVSDDLLTRSIQLGVTDSLGLFTVRAHGLQQVIFEETDTTGIGYSIE